MADKRLTQSPQAIRGTSQDFEQFGDRSVSLGMNDPHAPDKANAGAWEHQGELSTSQRDLTGKAK
jgi:hypothetical protein